METILNRTYDNLKLVAFQLEHFRQDYKNESSHNPQTKEFNSYLDKRFSELSDDVLSLLEVLYEASADGINANLQTLISERSNA